VDNLRGASNPTFTQRANADYFLAPGPGGTVYDDGAADTLSGGEGNCWFFGNTSGEGLLDDVFDFGGKDRLDEV
jgi:hypothetical protein